MCMSSLNQPSQTNGPDDGPDDGPASASPDYSSDGPAAASSPKLSSYEVTAVQSSSTPWAMLPLGVVKGSRKDRTAENHHILKLAPADPLLFSPSLFFF